MLKIKKIDEKLAFAVEGQCSDMDAHSKYWGYESQTKRSCKSDCSLGARWAELSGTVHNWKEIGCFKEKYYTCAWSCNL